MALVLDSKQLHQLAHLAFPEIYQAALREEIVWLSLCCDGKRVKGSKSEPVFLVVKESWGRLDLSAEVGVSWTVARDLKSRPCVGVSLGRDSEPLHYSEFSGYLAPVHKNDTVTLSSPFKVSVVGS